MTDRLPRYRVLTGPDDAAFCHRVSDAMNLGYELHGGPALTHGSDGAIVAQALIWPSPDEPPLVPTQVGIEAPKDPE
ncbi:DUF1737 domain-containing protein [Rhodococcoides fascians]|jgi:hypothetical protein|uniref:DUF1737 domain-containing protein n=1 Tax=Rhodococcoides fascians TaxID=1828 RepID=UPI000651152C|nr:DUF1737 domain-containing protein [Rhodococcus fascians]KMJ50620.1 hypothetical protein ACG96_07605 [Rhodococcus fascians]